MNRRGRQKRQYGLVAAALALTSIGVLLSMAAMRDASLRSAQLTLLVLCIALGVYAAIRWIRR
jgi:hypothetical protein